MHSLTAHSRDKRFFVHWFRSFSQIRVSTSPRHTYYCNCDYYFCYLWVFFCIDYWQYPSLDSAIDSSFLHRAIVPMMDKRIVSIALLSIIFSWKGKSWMKWVNGWIGNQNKQNSKMRDKFAFYHSIPGRKQRKLKTPKNTWIKTSKNTSIT